MMSGRDTFATLEQWQVRTIIGRNISGERERGDRTVNKGWRLVLDLRWVGLDYTAVDWDK